MQSNIVEGMKLTNLVVEQHNIKNTWRGGLMPNKMLWEIKMKMKILCVNSMILRISMTQYT